MARLDHTPGPWTLNEESANRVTGPRGETVAATYGGAVGDPEQVANTRLIAWAPAMYDYLARKAGESDDDASEIVAAIEGPES